MPTSIILFLCMLCQMGQYLNWPILDNTNTYVSTGRIKERKLWVLVAALFLHDGLAHFANNMLLFCAYGFTLQRFLSTSQFCSCYLFCGVFGWTGIFELEFFRLLKIYFTRRFSPSFSNFDIQHKNIR